MTPKDFERRHNEFVFQVLQQKLERITKEKVVGRIDPTMVQSAEGYVAIENSVGYPIVCSLTLSEMYGMWNFELGLQAGYEELDPQIECDDSIERVVNEAWHDLAHRLAAINVRFEHPAAMSDDVVAAMEQIILMGEIFAKKPTVEQVMRKYVAEPDFYGGA